MRVEIEHYTGEMLTIYDDWKYEFFEDAPVNVEGDRIDELITIYHNAKGYEGVEAEDGASVDVMGQRLAEHSTEYKMRMIARGLMQGGRFVEFTIYDES